MAVPHPSPRKGTGAVDGLRRQDFGLGTLLMSAVSAVVLETDSTPGWQQELFTPLYLAVAAISIWRIIEHQQARKAGVTLSVLQFHWLQAVKAEHGHAEAVRQLRRMFPRISRNHAENIIENLHKAGPATEG